MVCALPEYLEVKENSSEALQRAYRMLGVGGFDADPEVPLCGSSRTFSYAEVLKNRCRSDVLRYVNKILEERKK